MISADALECTAVANPVFQQGNQIFLGQAQWRCFVQSVKIYTIQGPSTKAVSFWFCILQKLLVIYPSIVRVLTCVAI
jgi:hypothetical protein